MTSQTSSEFFFNEINNSDIINDTGNDLNLDLSTDVKLEETSHNSLIGNKRKLETIGDPYQISDEINNSNDTEPPIKKAKLSQNTNTNTSQPNLRIESESTPNNTYALPPPPIQHIQHMQPMHSPYVFLSPIMPHMPHYMPHSYPYPLNPYPYYSYPHLNTNQTKNENVNNKRKRKNSKRTNNKSEKENVNKTERDKNVCNKSPFRATYISSEAEMELKTNNSVLYSQFDHARQTVYQRYQTKIEEIRRSNLLNPKQRKLKIKILAIDAKVREMKMFLNYSQMSKPNTGSWLVSNTKNKNTKNKNAKSESNNSANDKDKKQSKKRVKQPKFSECNVRVLRDWYETHTSNPYPSSTEKHLMCQLTGLTKYQVSRWFCNVRTRKPPPELSDNDEDIKNASENVETNYQSQYYQNMNMYAPYYANPQISHFNFGHTMPNISNTHSNILSTNQQMQQIQQMQRENLENNMNNSEELASINSNFNIQNSNNSSETNLILPPLIDEQ